MTSTVQSTPRTRRAIRRRPNKGLVAGVIAGLSESVRVDPLLLRIAFVVLVFATGGLALLGYAVAWALMPVAGGRSAIRLPGLGLRPGGWRIAAGAALLTLAALLVFRELGIWWSDALVWPVVLAVAGGALLWRQSQQPEHSPADADPATAPAPPSAVQASRVAGLYRGGFGIALVIGAALLFLYANGALEAANDAALAAVVAIAALGLILAPFLWRLARNLASERAERIRSQERAELAAHLHDSVLQTLALVQKRAGDPREVATLARRQERELRSWLIGDRERDPGTSLARSLEDAAAAVEDAHGVPVDVVLVGDAALDERAEALVAATREALVNAAKFAPDAGAVALYGEVADGRAQVFVRDRGSGFDPDSLPADRRGVRESIVGRMRRYGGRSAIRSSAERGTEVELTIGVDAPAEEPS